MKIIGKGTAVRLFDDKNKEIVGISRLVILLPDRRIVFGMHTTFREALHVKQADFIADVYETKEHGTGCIVMRDEKTGKLKLKEIKGKADVVIERP